MTIRIWARTGNLSYWYFAEDIGIEPNTRRYISLSRRTLSPSRFIFLVGEVKSCQPFNSLPIDITVSIVFTRGYDPITSDVSDRRSTNWATWTCCGQGRVRSYNLSVNSRLLYQLSYLSILLWERRDSNPQVLTETDLQSAEPTNCSTLPYIYKDNTFF